MQFRGATSALLRPEIAALLGMAMAGRRLPLCMTVCAVIVNGADADAARFQRDVDRTAQVFAQCGLRVAAGRVMTIDDATLLDHPMWNCTGTQPADTSRLLSMSGPCARGDVLAFYIRSMGGGFIGCGGGGLANGRPSCVLTDFAPVNTLPHELGHVFLGGNAAHNTTDLNNVMWPTPGAITADPPQMTAAQCTTVGASRLPLLCTTPIPSPVAIQVPRLPIPPERLMLALATRLAPLSGVRGLLLAADESLEAVVSLGQPAVPELTMLMTSDPSPVIRTRAAAALGQIGGPVATQALARAARADTNPIVRLTAANSLGQIGGPVAEMVLMATLQDPDPGVRATAMRSLTALGTPVAQMMVGRMAMVERNPQIRQLAGQLIRRFGTI